MITEDVYKRQASDSPELESEYAEMNVDEPVIIAANAGAEADVYKRQP